MPYKTTNPPHRILILSSEFPPGPGGIGTHAAQLAGHLQKLNWDVQVVAPQPYVSEAEKTAFNAQQSYAISSLEKRDKGAGWLPRRLLQIKESAQTFAPDVIVATGSRSLWLGGVLARWMDIPWLAVGHGGEFVNGSGWMRHLNGRSTQQADQVVAVSQYTANLIHSVCEPRQLAVIPNGADDRRFQPDLDGEQLRNKLGLQDRTILLTVGHVSKRKAQDVVIRALPQIVGAHPDVMYVMAGLPSLETELSRLAMELNVSEHIMFVGKVSDEELPIYYNLADIFVLVSRRTETSVEGYGIVVKEAALCGLPAIVSSGCGLQEAVVEGETGILVQPDNPTETAVAIKTLLQDDQRRQQMGQRATQFARQGTWAHRIADYDILLQNLITQ